MPPRATRRTFASAAQFRDLFCPAGLLLVPRCCQAGELALSGWAATPRTRLAELTNAHPGMVAGTWTLENSRESVRSADVEGGSAAVRDQAVQSDPISGRSRRSKRQRTSVAPTHVAPTQECGKSVAAHDAGAIATPSPADEAAKLLAQEGASSAWYGSYVLQHEGAALASMLAELPFGEPPARGLRHLQCVWLFFGQNRDDVGELPGRSEHTDKVVHDGTWHLQLAGRKRWRVRPTTELLVANPNLPERGYDVVCESGDLLMINTRLWWHQTSIPSTSEAADGMSLSVARDFYFDDTDTDTPSHSNPGEGEECDMANVDGLFATDDVAAGTVILSEHDVGAEGLEIELDDDPNCELVETDDGDTLMVSVRDIAVGEWFTLAKDPT
jgi:hypothetical protein